MSCYPTDLHPGDFYSLYIEHLDTRRRALIVIHSSAPITRTD